MNLPELTPIRNTREREHSLQRSASSSTAEPSMSRSSLSRAAWIAGATAFVLTATWITAAKKLRQSREPQSHLGGETIDSLVTSAERIVNLIEQRSRIASTEGGYLASFPLELEREQHQMIEAYANLYHKQSATEQHRLAKPDQLLLFNGIAAFEALPLAEVLSKPAANRSGAVGKLEQVAAASANDLNSTIRFVPDAVQRQTLGDLYGLCLNIREYAKTDRSSEYSTTRMLDFIQRQISE